VCSSDLGMAVEPFEGVKANGRISGRGACDTKGSAAAMLVALQQWSRQAGRHHNVAVLLSSDEEHGKTGVKAFARDHLPELSWDVAGVVVGEPTRLRCVAATGGVVRWPIHTRGVSVHSSDPSRGRSAISDMTRVIDAIESRYIPSLTTGHAMVGRSQCSINLIEGGTQINMIPDRCTIQLDRRLVPGEVPGDVLGEVEPVLDRVRQEHPGLEVEQGEPFMDTPLDPTPNAGWIEHVGSVLRQLGIDAEPMGVPFGTNGSCYGQHGIPAVVLGPGDIAQAHSKDEWIAVDQLHAAVDVYRHLMLAAPPAHAA